MEGLISAKLETIERIAYSNKATVILMQETHKINPSTLKISGFVLTGYVNSKRHGLAMFVHADVTVRVVNLWKMQKWNGYSQK